MKRDGDGFGQWVPADDVWRRLAENMAISVVPSALSLAGRELLQTTDG